MTLACTPTSITTAQTSTCTPTVNHSDGTTNTKATFAATGGTITAAGVFSSTTVGTGKVTATSTEDVSKASSPFSVAVTAATEQLTSASPRGQLCIGQCAFAVVTLFGANIPSTITIGDVNCTPDPNIQFIQWINSGEVKITLGIDQIHEGSGDRDCKLRKSDGTFTNAIPFGLYSHNTCVTDPSNGEKFCLNSAETVAGQHLFQGQPLNGYVDKFTASGTPDGNFFVGAPTVSIAFDPLTKTVAVDGGLHDENGQPNGPQLLNTTPGTVVDSAAANGFECYLQPTLTNNLAGVDITGGMFSQTTVEHLNVGSNPQSIAMGVAGGKITAYVFTVGGGTSTLWSVNVTTNALTIITSQPVPGLTPGVPEGSDIILFDSLGVGMLVSYGDNLAYVFDETTLKQVGQDISLSGTPVGVTAHTAGGVAVIGIADPISVGGTFIAINPVTGTTTPVSGEATQLPVGVTPAASGKSFYACSWTDATCDSFSIP